MEQILSIFEIASKIGELQNLKEDKILNNISLNSKEIRKNSVFIAISGEKFDGHDFLKEAFDNGAILAIVNKNKKFNENIENKCGLIKVNDTNEALLAISKLYKEKFNVISIAITGSVGKTTTKDLMYNVISEKYKTIKTEGNYNNHIGVPLSLFNITNVTQAIACEFGMNHKGEISKLSKICKPDYSIITNIGLTHIGNLGSKENILKAKLEILEGMNKDSLLILNSDDDLLYKYKDKIDNKLLYYGIENKNADIIAEDIGFLNSSSRFKIKINKKELKDKCNISEKLKKNLEFNVNTIGKHQIMNSLAAISIGLNLGIDILKIKKGLENFKLEKMRQNILKLKNIIIFEDCYNSSPTAFIASEEAYSLYYENYKTTLTKEYQNKVRKVAIIGSMLELGKFSEIEHANIGNLLAGKKYDLIILVGSETKIIKDILLKINNLEVLFLESVKDGEKIIKYIKPFDIIFVKGSRGVKLELIIEKINHIGLT